MAVVAINNQSIIKARLDCGVGPDQKPIMKLKTFSYVKHNATDDDIFAVSNALVSLQKHTLFELFRIDSTSLAE